MTEIDSKEVAKILGITKTTVSARVRKGLIPTVNKAKKGSKRTVWKYDKDVIERIAHGEKPIQERVEDTLKKSSHTAHRKNVVGLSRLERIEAKLDRLLKILG